MKALLKLCCLATLLSLALLLGATPAAAQPALLYEVVENLDVVTLLTTNVRVSNWTAQGTAPGGSPLCPTALLAQVAPGATSCSITAFGMDSIDLNVLYTTPWNVGTLWVNVAAVANFDNAVDAPEAVVMTGQIMASISILSPAFTIVSPNLNAKKAALGPQLPLLYLTGGFVPDVAVGPDGNPVLVPTIRTQPGDDAPALGSGTPVTATFRLPFKVGTAGGREKPERGKLAYYLADDGSLIKVGRNTEYSLGFPALRAELTFP